jgi:glycosyltransferase involved in cell wall biosynthesis
MQGCCPLKIVESMACGTPVIASDLPAVRELISSGNDGMLVPPDSPRALAGALESLLEDVSMRDRLAQGARQRAVKEFRAKLLAERLGAVYTSL